MRLPFSLSKAPRWLAPLGLLAALWLSTGCVSSLAPKTAALQHVHEIYTEEFTLVNVPAAAEATAAGKPATGAAFAQSLRAINEYRVAYPGESQELAHLQVLEGMVYLQSGRFGLAAAVKPDVEAAEAKLASGTGKIVRDRLFAQNFGLLLEGWRETRKENDRSWQTFARVADALGKALQEIPAAQRPAVSADQGALYLATSAAIFYVWAQRQLGMSEERATAPARKIEWYGRARDAIGGFLTDAEKRADISKDLGTDAPQGRLRYVQWYHWLNDELKRP